MFKKILLPVDLEGRHQHAIDSAIGLARHDNADVVLLHTAEKANRVLLHRAIGTEALPEGWRAHFAKKLAGLG